MWLNSVATIAEGVEHDTGLNRYVQKAIWRRQQISNPTDLVWRIAVRDLH